MEKVLRIAIGADHAGLNLKNHIKRYLLDGGYDVDDLGTYGHDSCDYPDFARKVADRVASGEDERGILVCTTGIGMSIAANKVTGIRAALCVDEECARLSREHNDANVLVLGARAMRPGKAQGILKVWLETNFAGGRHLRRVDKIRAIEKDQTKTSRLG